ncbi:unnamed protein product [Fusarium graminearum]|uniref:Chromosome 1, complete genome n=2 Tax=Gibberella zeae TaxID=5518 RepID=I1RFY9_GIBZE|nr:hypothetical protein FGSG_02635 [Fusarium graminearum PH-1]EYB31928.1 hypothetical protein FG05_02635 [Fusarium graminearum]ESU08100.1 hypothetical protein FGSG_02635 [Fusarium graminearum PH-1]CAF3437262.1 unnamed protein product [Fusarium graminearum]CAF3454883.1 unnamed protein product [Fusarium graminearum]CAF3582745.1 unnamed protein product [Fusarium graminearum]|eukprot:XP_011318585.1 hypothetical protein FGSG_02635 [Fusarium graminearum PH-1]
MEPNKRRKLAPKVNATTPSKPPPPPTQFPHESPQQHHPPQEAVPAPLSERHDFESFARHLQDAAMLIQRQTERHPYTDVSVLLLRWEDDESVDEDLTALEQVLQKQYKYRTEKWHIPTVPDLSKKLGVQMASFLEHAKPNHLLIIYYAGHGYVSSDGQLFWACNTREDAAKLKWDGVRCLFEDAQSDILLLLDTCAVPDPPMAGSHGVKQAIAARASDRSPDSLERSFTSNLTEALQKLSSGRPFTTQRLHEEVLFLKKQQQLLQTPRQTNGSTSNTQSSPQNPVFIPLTPGKGQSIALAPMPSRPRTGSQNGHDADGQGNREEQLIDPESVVDLRFEEPRVLVCTTFVGDASPDMSFFSQWLHSTPPLGDKIAVEGMFLGPPTMLLISMPHSIWNVVQHDKVCCFLGYISSHNMIHLYHKLVGSSGVKPSAREVEDGRILLEARDHAFSTPARVRREEGPSFHSPATREAPNSVERKDYLPQASPSAPAYANSTGGHSKPKDEVEDSAEMQEAAEQLKALSHVRHPSDDITNINRPRTILPDGLPEIRPEGDNDEHGNNDPLATLRNANATVKPPRRSLPKQDTRCNHCSHAPFKDSSSLRKHIAAAHTRPFPCAFSFAGCTSTFGSKNEWKRHIASQHLCLQYYRCSSCPQSTAEGKGNEFNRKDLFTQHLRRMHAPFQIKRALAKGDSKLQSEWEAHVKEMQVSCLVQRRLPPQRSACPKQGCQSVFEGPSSWDEWTEHVGRHMEKGEGGGRLGVDGLLAQWALDEGIIERKTDGEYRLSTSNGISGGGNSGGMPPAFEQKESTLTSVSTLEPSQPEDSLIVETNAKPPEDRMEVDTPE